MKMGKFDISNIDRRWIYITILLGALLPLFVPITFAPKISPEVKAVYDYIDKLPPGSVILLSFDYGPSTLPETEPMAEDIMKHAFINGVRVIGISLTEEGALLALKAYNNVVKEFENYGTIKVNYGYDFVFLGYKSGRQAVILSIGEDIRKTFPTDYQGTSIDDIPMMFNVKNYKDISLVVDISSTNTPNDWITYAYSRYKVPVAVGVTAVLAANYYPFIQTGQIIGLIGGVKGASEYEYLVNQKIQSNWGMKPKRIPAMRNMSALTVAELLIVLFIILGNIGYFSQKGNKRR